MFPFPLFIYGKAEKPFKLNLDQWTIKLSTETIQIKIQWVGRQLWEQGEAGLTAHFAKQRRLKWVRTQPCYTSEKHNMHIEVLSKPNVFTKYNRRTYDTTMHREGRTKTVTYGGGLWTDEELLLDLFAPRHRLLVTQRALRGTDWL